MYCNGKRLGVFGKLANEINGELEIAKDQKDSQNIYLGELDYEALMSCVDGELRYQPLSPYAPVKRDLALVCDEAVTCGEIEETIQKASPLVSEVKLFDIYRGANLGEGKKSMAFTLSLCRPEEGSLCRRSGARRQEDPWQPEVQAGHRDPLTLYYISNYIET